jgi:hypothetical protein
LSARLAAAALAAALIAGLAGAAPAAPPDDRVLRVEQYTSDKGRKLALTHAQALRDLNAEVYHCLPWVEVQKESIGFFKPRHLAGDVRYLSIRIFIEQDPSPSFAALTAEQRASAMYSRYVGPLLARMTRSQALARDPDLQGFTIILEWLKQAARRDGRPVHETIAVFIERPVAADYLSGVVGIREMPAKTHVRGWDGDQALGVMRVSAWDDDFVFTYKIKGYQLEKGVTCQ